MSFDGVWIPGVTFPANIDTRIRSEEEELLREALTAANGQIAQWKHNHDERKAERDVIQSQLDRIKSLPFVPRAQYDIAVDTKNQALATLDGLTREVANLRDKRANVALREAVGYIQAELREHAKEFAHPPAAIRRNLMRAFVVEHGGKVGEE